jgi:tetratricopeptide (TPR) repeat protein
MMKKIYLILSVIAIAGLLATSVIFFLKSNTLTSQLEQTKQLLMKTDEQIKHIQTEREKLTKENEKLQADAVSYLALNNDLQKVREDLDNRLKDAQKIIGEKEADLERTNKKIDEIEKKIAKAQTSIQEKLQKEKKELEGKIKSLEETLQKERGLYHYNLAVSYAQAKLYDEAIASYEKSLTFNPDNADAHYNLGVLYADFKSDSEKAISHYRKYLELKPDANDKEEVLRLMEKLK